MNHEWRMNLFILLYEKKTEFNSIGLQKKIEWITPIVGGKISVWEKAWTVD